MRSDKLPYLQKVVSVTFTMQRKTIIAFENRVQEMGLNKHRVIEELMKGWIYNTKKR